MYISLQNYFRTFILKFFILEPQHEKTCLRGVPTRSDTKRAVQPQKMVTGLTDLGSSGTVLSM